MIIDNDEGIIIKGISDLVFISSISPHAAARTEMVVYLLERRLSCLDI